MKVSYNWLQTYFKEQLPSPEKLVDLFTFHSFEIEGLEKIGEGENADYVIDAKILPDRAHYALSHRGIAAEIAALSTLTYAEGKNRPPASEEHPPLPAPVVKVTDTTFCLRYMARRIESVQVSESPDWLKNRLQAIGARSINSIVDSTNFVMFDTGQPLHAFDADKVKGELTVRAALPGEHITTLDAKDIELTSADFVIADNEGPLAIAGVKGGKRAEVTMQTKNIIIEAANFDAVSIRKTSTRVGIRNDSSKRFENALTPELTSLGMSEVTRLIKELSPKVVIGSVFDMYPHKAVSQTIAITPEYIRQTLGVDISDSEILNILSRLTISVHKKDDSVLEFTVPFERLDLTRKEDIAEEIGRMYGYDKIPSHLPPQTVAEVPINKTFYYCEKIKTILRELGISEVYLYALTAKGHHEVAYPLASDKSYLRTNLTHGVEKTLELNVQNAPLLGLEKIKVFEIGKVFTEDGEHTALCVGVAFARKFKGQTVNEEIRNIREHLLEKLGSSVNTVCTIDDTGGILMLSGKPIGIINNKDGILELNLDKVIEKLPEPKEWDLHHEEVKEVKYKPFSMYPFAVRDVAVFVPQEIQAKDIEVIITKHAGELLIRTDLFDVFTKKNNEGQEKTSYAFHIVLQSFHETLTEPMITHVMDGIYGEFKDNGWEVR